MAFKLVVLAAFVAVARASGLGHTVPALALGAHNSVSSYSTIQQHNPAVHTYAAPAVHAYAAPAVQAYAAHAPAIHTYSAAAPAIAYAAPIAKTVIAEPSAPTHYDFGYGVNDPLTGDIKSQHESRRGDVVQGSYSLLESDGTKRTVDYSADAHNGFNAVVHKEPAAVAVKVAAPVALAAPVAHAYAAPVAHAYAAPSLVQGAHGYSAPTVAHGYLAPTVAHGYTASTVAHGYAAPTIAHGVAAHGIARGYAAPSVAHGYAVPAVAHAPVLAHNVW
ncbi:hypothetical protein JTB14_027862 [Gonioctena quinquepunctata]|nr:hypothetical protein JTB14_027862 [Gonioctena quinquepunctata]